MTRFLLLIIFSLSISGTHQTQCGKNEELVTCANPCQPSCSWKDRPPCPTFACSAGCQCQEGYYRATNETSSACIKCDQTQTCGKNEELVDCANPCQPSCSWKNRPPCPTLRCSAGCQCQAGYYRATNETNSACIKCDEKKTCGKNEELVKCANPCQPSCSWKNRPPCPTFACSAGCQCQAGYYRATNQANSACIKCDEKKTCGKNEELVKCANPCQPSCSWKKRPPCPTLRCSVGCQCQAGYYRATNQTNSACIKCDEKKTCGKNEELVTCANPCQPSCSWKDRPPCPTFACSAGCACRENFYRATNETSSPCIICKEECD